MVATRLTTSLPRLRWVAIGLPIVLVLLTLVANHVLFEPVLGEFDGHALTAVLMVPGVVVFGLAIFRILEEKERTILRQARQAQALHQFGAEVSSLLDPVALIRLVVDRAHEILDVDLAGLARLDDKSDTLVWDHVITDNSSDGSIRSICLRPGEGIAGFVVTTRTQLAIADIESGLPSGVGSAPILERNGMRSAMAVPLQTGDHVHGVLLVANRAPTVFSDEAQTLLTSLANQVAVALTNAELFSRAQFAADRLEQLIESSGDAIITTDLDGRILSWNQGAEEIYGWSRDEAVGAVLPMVPTDLGVSAREIIREVFDTGEVLANVETERIRKNGERIQVVVTASPIRGPGESVVGLLGISKDMSAHRQLEQQQRRLALLEDRERIGIELHDGAIQSLYAVGLGIETVAQVLEEDPSLARARLELTRDAVDTLIQEIRNYIFGLRPEAFMADGLAAGLAGLAQEVNVNALIDVELAIDTGVDRAFRSERAEEIFQIAREALRNVVRHANARRVKLAFQPTRDAWVLRIWDNGVGFDPEEISGSGLGMRNMRARARRIGGNLTISSELCKSTEVTLLVQPDQGN